MGEEMKEQLLTELLELQRELKKKLQNQNQMTRHPRAIKKPSFFPITSEDECGVIKQGVAVSHSEIKSTCSI